MGREVRMVPAEWNHPKRENGNYIPLLDGSFEEAEKEWNEGYQQWQKGFRESWGDGDKWVAIDEDCKNMQFSEYNGSRPSPDDYMPVWKNEECTHLMMYETCSEGTPISPAFKTPEELAHWLADNGAYSFGHCTATYEQWLATCRNGWAMSAVSVGGKLTSGVEASEPLKAE